MIKKYGMSIISKNNKTKKNSNGKDLDKRSNRRSMTDEEIANLDVENKEVKQLMEEYQEETDKYAIWRGSITEGFKKWLKGEKIYDRDKERISLYVSEETKKNWQDFKESHEYSTISALIRESVDYYIEQKSDLFGEGLRRMDDKTISNISHALKEPLTTIKGFSQLLLENYNEELNEEVLLTIKNIFDQSLLLENKIINILDNIAVEELHPQYDILLIEDDLATIRLLTSYFESKGYKCKGVVSGTKGIEQIRGGVPKLILLDIILPDISGYEICKMIKDHKVYKEIPVYLLTAIPGSEVEKKMGETKADGYILKPFDFSDFEVVFQYL
ncbi:MAG: response regulator [Candidatus Lokiarchaeota archaeon]|nr:response regulator [Candidatus Lokiarchaeota archaeon]